MTLEYKTLEELHTMLVNKEVTVEEIVTNLYDRIDEMDEQIGSFLYLNKEQAIAQAKKADEDGIDPENVLSGLPIAIKDNIVTRDQPTTAASYMLEDFRSVYDATVVQQLNDVGMISIGKLNMDEFAMGGSTENSAYKICHNPWDLSRVPGGSSGGSAAAVAAGFVPASLGTDTGGSIRQPASFNGIVGMKPTYGRVSRYGLIAFASSLDQIGPMTRTVKDNALVLNAISGHDEMDSTSYPGEKEDFTKDIDKGVKGLKIGLPRKLFKESALDDDVMEVIEEAVSKYEELGAEIVEIDLKYALYGTPTYYILASSEASSNLQRFDGIHYGYRSDKFANLDDIYVNSRSEGFGPEVKRRIMLGTFSLSSGYYDAHFEKAARVRTLIGEDFQEAFEKVDVVLTPSSLTPAYKIGGKIENPLQMYKEDTFTVSINLAGIPAISIPCGFVNDLPIGLQLIGNHFEEQKLYQTAYAFEQATDHHNQRPEFKGGA